MMKDLILEARRDEEALYKLVKQFEPLIKKCVRRYIHDENLKADAIHEGYITIMKCIRLYDVDSPCSFPGYVKTAVINNMRNYARTLRETLSLDEEYTEDGGTLMEILTDYSTIEDVLPDLMITHALAQAIQSLNKNELELLYSIYYKNIKIIALSNGTRSHYAKIQRTKNHALEKLRYELKKQGYEQPSSPKAPAASATITNCR